MSTQPPAKHISFFGHIENFFAKIFADKQAWEKTAQVAIAVVGPLLTTVVSLAAGTAAGSKVSQVISTIQKDLQDAGALLASDTGGTAKQQAVELLTGVQTQLQTLLTDADVKNSAEAQKITLAINAVDGELQAILAAV